MIPPDNMQKKIEQLAMLIRSHNSYMQLSVIRKHLRELDKLPGNGLEMVRLLMREKKYTVIPSLFKLIPELRRKDVSATTPVLRTHPYRDGYNATSHNCFAYALNLRSKKFQNMFLQVSKGLTTFSRIIRSAHSNRTRTPAQKLKLACKGCDKIMKQLIPGIRQIDFATRCGANRHKICMVVSIGDRKSGSGSDFHFLRLNKLGLWSHKPGSTPITATDKNDKLIFNPKAPGMRFEVNGHPYRFCHFYSVPVQTEKDIARIQGLDNPTKQERLNLNTIQMLKELSQFQNLKLFAARK